MSPRAKYVPLRLKHLPFSNLISWQWRGVQAVDGDGLTQDIVFPIINLWLDLCLSSEDFHFPPACLQYGGVKPCSRPSLITNSGRAAEKNMVFIMSGVNPTDGVHQSNADPDYLTNNITTFKSVPPPLCLSCSLSALFLPFSQQGQSLSGDSFL